MGILNDVGNRIRRIRESQAMTQHDLAKKVGLVRSSIANIESGRQNVGLEQLDVIARQLGVTPAELLPIEVNGISDETFIGGAAVATKLYVTAAVDRAEQQIKEKLAAVFGEVRSAYIPDTKSGNPFALLLKAEELWQKQQEAARGDP